MPEKEQDRIIKFRGYKNTLKQPYVMNAIIEAIVTKEGEQIPCGYGIKVVSKYV